MKKIGVGEFVRELLDGERNFRGVRFPDYANLSDYEGFVDLNNYLRKQRLSENPVDITGSKFRYVKARGLYLPYALGESTNFDGADLSESCLMRARFRHSHFWNAHFNNADLWEVDFESANLERAIFNRAIIYKANFRRANIKGAEGLYLQEVKDPRIELHIGFDEVN